MKHLLYLLLLLPASLVGKSMPDLPFLHPDSARKELRELFEELKIKHPGFYRYQEPMAFDARIDSTLSAITRPVTELDLLRIARPLIADIGCLHTGIRLSEATAARLDSFPNCLPLALHYQDGHAYVWQNFAEGSGLKPGDEILSINGKSMQQIYAQLLEQIPMDGHNLTGKYRLLQYMFAQWYRTGIEVTDRFEVQTADGRLLQLSGIGASALPSYAAVVTAPMSLRMEEDLAVIRIPSFSDSYLRSHGQKFRKEIDRYFREIREAGSQRLLLDLRHNTGGTDSNPAWLSGYFFDAPYRYWDRITVTEPVAEGVHGMNRFFYGKPTEGPQGWEWGHRGIASKEFRYTEELKPHPEPFRGQVYVLADGLCMSSCSDFVAVMQHHGGATILGEETGGGYQGNTSGLIPEVQLSCGLIVDVPLLAYYNHVDTNLNHGHGTLPAIYLVPELPELLDPQSFQARAVARIRELRTR